jgi:hypothetical protein
MTKEEENAFNSCKKQERKDRKPKYRYRPTACLKKPTKVTEEATNQDYNLLWQYVNEQIEESSGIDMSKELPISEFVESTEPKNNTSSSIQISSISSNSTIISNSISSTDDI